ncbi:MAG TPA: bifunctional phosphopantothenoylcysteine decarboxylase/phosphopantothenate--cysteine ligase CoaBC [Thermoleophilaceae bacterium]|nr:bifunctional phosphopantothenoylcysteine decarboxylase/phosphopantothenate--cysteine ligase CoaBC [Thermoleophilaceae bacterium]
MARILLGVCGGIAAYKAVELTRLAIGAGHSVRVVQTETAERFVGRATFEGITGAPALVSEWERDPARGAYPGDPAPDQTPISHLELVRRADILAIAPASANTLAKLAAGIADNLLTSAALALRAPLVLAPAMNERMWDHPATRANLRILSERGATVLDPETGALASRGEWGAGRLPDPPAVLAAIESALEPSRSGYAPRSLDGLGVLVTAGGTREPIDAVRFVGNRSSGRMGFALAEEAARRGAETTVVAANVDLSRAEGIRYREVVTAGELADATRAELASADVLLMAAAVADFRPTVAQGAKIEKAGRRGLALELEPTEDVLSSVAQERRGDQTVVGFAAEHGAGALARAREKLERKRLDAIVLNDVSGEGVGFEAEDNAVTILTAEGEREVPRASKREVAREIIDAVESLRAGASAPRSAAAGSGAAGAR